jgi:hypothetical protein
MAKTTNNNDSKNKKSVVTLTHDEASRKNIPTAEYQSVMRKDEQSPVRLAYERRNRDLDPQLVWRGKDEQDWSDLVVQAPPLYIQEKVHPKVLIDDLLRRSEADAAGSPLRDSPPMIREVASIFCRRIQVMQSRFVAAKIQGQPT